MSKHLEETLILVTANSKLESTFEGFQFPESGEFDSSTDLCGLHFGEGNSQVIDFDAIKWLVLKIKFNDLKFHNNEFVSFKKGSVILVGNKQSATSYIFNNGGDIYYINGLEITVANDMVIKAGDNANIKCGMNCIVVAGNDSNVFADFGSKVKVGHSSSIFIEDTSTCQDCFIGNRFPTCNYSNANIRDLNYFDTMSFFHKNGPKLEVCNSISNYEKYLLLE